MVLDRWTRIETLAACRRLVDEGHEAREFNGTQGADPRYAQAAGDLAPMGRLQVVCTGVGPGCRVGGYPNVAHALGRQLSLSLSVSLARTPAS